MAMNRDLSVNMGDCNHRTYLPRLIWMVRTGRIEPLQIPTKMEPLTAAVDAYKHFDKRERGWIKTKLTVPEPPTAAAE